MVKSYYLVRLIFYFLFVTTYALHIKNVDGSSKNLAITGAANLLPTCIPWAAENTNL